MRGRPKLRYSLWAVALLLCLGLAACGPGSVREGWLGRGQPWFEAQLLSGYSPSGEQLATLVVTVPHRNLVFFADGDGFVSSYRVRAVVKSGGTPLSSDEWLSTVRVESYEETRSSTVAEKTVQLEMAEADGAEPDAVVVSLSVEGTQRRSALTLAYAPAKLEQGGVSIAEAEFYLLRDGATALSDVIMRLGEGVVPDPKRFARAPSTEFDLSTGEPWLWIRTFDLRAMPRAPMEVRVRSSGEMSPWQRSYPLEGEAVESARLLRVPAEALRFGKNEILIELEGAESRRIQLLNLGLDLRDPRSWESNLAHVEALASSEEFKQLKEAPADERAAAWDAFWKRRDPTPELSGNERLAEHYRRVSYARRNLRDGVGEGAISDRGRVYIQYGAPESVEDLTSRSDLMTTWQLWRYPREGIIYYFRLVHGGHYRLAWSERY